jgi:glyoxylase-like metal-dependent hydrolase (beta-lactamase superfamily II)
VTSVGLRLYAFDCGSIDTADMSRYRMTRQDVATTKLAVACYLVVHPHGVLLWDTGGIADSAWTPTGEQTTRQVVLADGVTRDITITTPLLPQLEAAGYPPERITYLALSHCHWDHTGNANAFPQSTWLTRAVERDAMFAAVPPALTHPSTFAALRAANTTVVTGDEFDVFGDGLVVMKLAPGHTPGHQVLIVQLPRTGTVVLSGDLYHYPEERTLGRVPTFEVDEAQTRASRAAIESLLTKTGAQLWIQHDFRASAALRKAPVFYD